MGWRLYYFRAASQIEIGTLLDLLALTNRFNDPIDIRMFAMIHYFSFGSSNTHGSGLNGNLENQYLRE